MVFTVKFYKDERKKKPTLEFLRMLQSKNIKLHDLTSASLVKVENSDYHKEPLIKKVDKEDKVWEIRTRASKVLSRIFFIFYAGQRIVTFNGYIKQDDKIDVGELSLAKRLVKQFWKAGGLNEE